MQVRKGKQAGVGTLPSKEEMKDKKDDVKEELNEEVARFKKLAGLIK